jgi:hypothetical protein
MTTFYVTNSLVTFRYWINPANIGYQSLQVTMSNGTTQAIGDLYSYMDFSGM